MEFRVTLELTDKSKKEAISEYCGSDDRFGFKKMAEDFVSNNIYSLFELLFEKFDKKPDVTDKTPDVNDKKTRSKKVAGKQ